MRIKVFLILIGCLLLSDCGVKTYASMDDPVADKISAYIASGYFWDAHYTYTDEIIGLGWHIVSDSTLLEYVYDRQGTRVKYDYGDFELDTLKWAVSGDVFYISDLYKLRVIKYANDT